MAAVSEVRRNIRSPQQVRFEMSRLRYQFLMSQLDISYTLATFIRPAQGEKLSDACRCTAQKGYHTAATGLAQIELPETEKQVIESKLERLRKALEGNPEQNQNGCTARSSRECSTSEKTAHGDDHTNGNGQTVRHDFLTRREREVLQCIAEGHSTKQVGALLGITFKTASCHRSRIMDKLEIHNLAGLVRYAIRERMIHA
jgi:DNA-binding CsgD family transcriptional regulator